MCSRADETTNHIESEYPKLDQKEYKRIGIIVSEDVFIGKIMEQMEFMLNRNVMSINKKRSLRMTLVKSFGILLYRHDKENCHVIDKENHECQIIDFPIPYDTRGDGKEVERIEKYLDLARELKKA